MNRVHCFSLEFFAQNAFFLKEKKTFKMAKSTGEDDSGKRERRDHLSSYEGSPVP